MKKIVLSMVGSLLIGACAVYAQQTDTTGSASNRDRQNRRQSDRMHQQHDRSSTQSDKWQQGDRTQGQDGYANEGMVIIDKSELPSSLKKTLQKDKYSGWENGTIYHNTNTDEYVIAPRAYRFDKNGKEMEIGDNAPGYGRSSRYGSGDQSMQRDRSGYQSSDQSTNPSSGYNNQSDRSGNNSQSSGQSGNNAGYNNQSSGQSDNTSGQSDRSQSWDQSDNASQSSQNQSGTNRKGQSTQQPSSEYRSGQDTNTGAGTQTQPGQSGREQSSSQNDQ